MTNLTITLPGRVWEDYLDPMASGMQAELGLSEPERKPQGKGWRAVYIDVPTTVAHELAEYLSDRAELLLGQDDDGQRNVHRAALKAAETIDRVAKLTAEAAAI